MGYETGRESTAITDGALRLRLRLRLRLALRLRLRWELEDDLPVAVEVVAGVRRQRRQQRRRLQVQRRQRPDRRVAGVDGETKKLDQTRSKTRLVRASRLFNLTSSNLT